MVSGRVSRRPRIAGIATFAALAVLVGGASVALAAPEVVHTWGQSMLSDLGSTTCFDAPGRRICSPRHGLFNAAMLGSGLLVLVSGVVDPPSVRSPSLWVTAAAKLVCGVGLVLLGLFPSDAGHSWHMVGAVLALPVTAGLVFAGTMAADASHRDRPLAAASLLALASSALHLIPVQSVRGAAEMVSVSSVCLTLVLLGLRDLRRDGRLSRPGA